MTNLRSMRRHSPFGSIPHVACRGDGNGNRQNGTNGITLGEVAPSSNFFVYKSASSNCRFWRRTIVNNTLRVDLERYCKRELSDRANSRCNRRINKANRSFRLSHQPYDKNRRSGRDLTVFLYQRMGDYCIGMISSRW